MRQDLPLWGDAAFTRTSITLVLCCRQAHKKFRPGVAKHPQGILPSVYIDDASEALSANTSGKTIESSKRPSVTVPSHPKGTYPK